MLNPPYPYFWGSTVAPFFKEETPLSTTPLAALGQYHTPEHVQHWGVVPPQQGTDKVADQGRPGATAQPQRYGSHSFERNPESPTKCNVLILSFYVLKSFL